MSLLVIHFERFGPYHHARLQSAREALDWDVEGLEIAPDDAVYGWDVEEGKGITRVFESGSYQDHAAFKITREVTLKLDELKPDAVAIAGYASPDARACLKWCKENGARAILMSETREADGQRVWWKEFLKGRVISKFDAALVGAKSHAAYLANFGLTNVHFGYNVVNNATFLRSADRKTPPVLLASSRFIERKNFAALLQTYRRSSIDQTWSLCLLGDGEERKALEEEAYRFKEGLPWEDKEQKPGVYFAGFRQIKELPDFYAKASAFIHPALSEPWGLVINEAMAAGLPILSSRNVGAAEELIDHGVNGWLFNPESVTEMKIYLDKLLQTPSEELQKMGEASKRILEERCPTSAFGKGMAAAVKS